jgi:Fic family protein
LKEFFTWHAAVFPIGLNNKGEIVNIGVTRGDYEMVVGGGGPKEIIYYQASPYDELFDYLVEFFDWFNKIEDSIIKVAISHLWFLIIHPLHDGNGKIARTICEYVLERVEKSYYSKIYSISKTIYENKKVYYEVLEQTTGFRINENPLDIGSKNFEGALTKKKYVAMTKASTTTVTNDLK